MLNEPLECAVILDKITKFAIKEKDKLNEILRSYKKHVLDEYKDALDITFIHELVIKDLVLMLADTSFYNCMKEKDDIPACIISTYAFVNCLFSRIYNMLDITLISLAKQLQSGKSIDDIFTEMYLSHGIDVDK